MLSWRWGRRNLILLLIFLLVSFFYLFFELFIWLEKTVFQLGSFQNLYLFSFASQNTLWATETKMDIRVLNRESLDLFFLTRRSQN
jgi:hypothetical protein